MDLFIFPSTHARRVLLLEIINLVYDVYSMNTSVQGGMQSIYARRSV